MIHTVKGFGIVNKAKVDVLLKLPCFFYDPTDVGNLFSGFSAFIQFSSNIWKFMVHILLKPGLENFLHYFASMWDEYNYDIVGTFFGIALLWDWNENWPFLVLWPPLSFPGGSVVNNSLANAGDVGVISQSEGGGNYNLLQYSSLEKIPWTEEPGELPSIGLKRVRLRGNWVTAFRHTASWRQNPGL